MKKIILSMALLVMPIMSQADALNIQYKLDGVNGSAQMDSLKFDYAEKVIELANGHDFKQLKSDFPADTGNYLGVSDRYGDYAIAFKFDGLILKYEGVSFSVNGVGLRWVDGVNVVYFDLGRI